MQRIQNQNHKALLTNFFGVSFMDQSMTHQGLRFILQPAFNLASTTFE